MKHTVLIVLIAMLSITGGCASHTAEQQSTQNNQTSVSSNKDPRDPFEPVNRVMWDLNWEILDKYLMRPVTIAYTTVMPQFARTGLHNAAKNLEEPGIMVNSFLQGKHEDGFASLSRLVLNSTVGILGVFDVAGYAGLERKEEGFDEVLGVWGVGNGPFLMLPGVGPTDTREVTGEIVDNIYYPMAVLNSNFTFLRWAIVLVERRAAFLSQESQLRGSPDDYAFIKNAYFQNKLFQVTDGKIAEPEIDDSQLDDFEDFESMLEDLDSGNER